MPLTMRFQWVGSLGIVSFRLSEPERDMRRLHRLVDHRQQMFAQLRQIYLLAQGSAEGGQRLLSVILAPIKAAIDQLLEATPHRQEEGKNCQRGDDQYGWIICRLPTEQLGQTLQPNDEACVQRCQQRRQRTID